MAMYGVYKGNAIVTEQVFPENQRFILIPVEQTPGESVNKRKLDVVNRLYGSVPDSGYSLESTREERLSRQ